ncbi:tetratricopeptide repeat protein [Caulobacter sp. DWR2-3-1b2]|uniref:tetratricopeptide repeat protein n=1 Tax=unclassified Caulobacter TaxID=2648921 RepID=UPI001995FC31|nr:tetratricopeptide repeat protein [Caulobacter sp.]
MSSIRSTVLVAAAVLAAGTAHASTLIIGGGAAKDCSNAALNGRADKASVTTCTVALDIETLNFRDRARTYVNRGVLYMRQRDFNGAVSDFDSASRIDPNLGEAFVNRGAAFVGTQRYDEGLSQIDQGLALGVKDPEKAYYNRAIAHENLGDVTAAYRDYSKALELDPAWDAPKKELARFTVKRP